MAHIEPVFSNIPPVTGDVNYSPLGGKVGLEAEDVANIQAVADPAATAAIEAGYGEVGDGAVLDHIRKRNLGY
jgi:hypothetical protein